MSKIFDALTKTDGEIASINLKVGARAGHAESMAEGNGAAVAPAREHAYATDQRPGPELSGGPVRTVAVRPEPGAPVLPFDSKEGFAASEQYRIIRTRISHHPLHPQMVVVSSTGAAEGKTVTAINVAGAMALRSDVNVLLLDADLRRSNVTSLLGIGVLPGIAEVLAGDMALSQVIVRVEQIPNLYVLPAGKVQRNAAELLDSPRWKALCAELREHFKYIVLDASPIGSGVADYELVEAVADGILFVVRPDGSDRKNFSAALQRLPQQKFLGVVMNDVRDWFLWKNKPFYDYETR